MTSTEPILYDAPDGSDLAFDRSFLDRNGHPVWVCPGPGGGACPLVEGRGCALFEHAAGVVFELDLDVPAHRDVVRAYRAEAPEGFPIWVLVRPGQADRYRDLLADVEVIERQPTAADLDGLAAEVEAWARG
jgi:hypothetical protein